jgi:hypothetical protein
MFKEYKFIDKVREEGKLFNWFQAIEYLLRTIEIGNYDFIKDKIWIPMKVWNQAIYEGINLGEIRF